MPFRRRVSLVTALLCAFCSVPVRQHSLVTNPASIDRSAKYLKAHLRNGDVYVMTNWSLDAAEKNVSGTADHYDARRRLLDRGQVTLPIGSVALFETNVQQKSRRVAALAVMTGITAAVTAICASSPKTCFGSCPTFYVDDGERWSLQAEGFSASIAPSLEATDLDALYRANPKSSRVVLRMTNEALETHVVKSVRLVAVPRRPGSRVFATSDRQFWAASTVLSPRRCSADEGDCASTLARFDGRERFSPADRHDLSRHEIIDLEFDDPGDRPAGVVIAARQTLLSTFLLYQGLAYLGSNATAVLAATERGDNSVEKRANGMATLLGGIDVLVEESGRWRKAATFNETGPLATDVRLLPIPGHGPRKIRLSMARGLWRVDYVALAALDGQVDPVALSPVEVRKDNDIFAAGETMTTFPGDRYEIAFELPPGGEQELFLETRGYYLEWMRDEWVAEESRVRAAMMFYTPHLALRVLAPAFKSVEPQIESQFWNSRYEKER